MGTRRARKGEHDAAPESQQRQLSRSQVVAAELLCEASGSQRLKARGGCWVPINLDGDGSGAGISSGQPGGILYSTEHSRGAVHQSRDRGIKDTVA